MNRLYWEDLVTSPAFSKLSKVNKAFIQERMLGPSPVENMSTGGDVTFEGVVLEVMSVEAPAAVPMVPRSPRLKPTRVQKAHKPGKDKHQKPMPVCESPNKTEKQPAKDKGKW